MAAQAWGGGGLVVSSQRLQAVAGVITPGGRAYGQAVWNGDGFHLVLGSLERTGRQVLLERYGGRVQQAVRLRGRGRTPGDPQCARRRPCDHGPGAAGQCLCISAGFSCALRQEQERGDRRPDPSGLYFLPREGTSERCQWPCADGPRPRTEQCCRWLCHRGQVCAVPKTSYHPERSG